MTGYKIANIGIMIEELGEDSVKGILSSFSCPLNKDVEQFLREKAISFSKQGWAQTHLVMASYQQHPVLVGYFALANKYITISSKVFQSRSGTLRRRINKFATYNPEIKSYVLAAPLIAQLGKNYTGGYNRLISGDELLSFACEKISRVQYDLGGRFAYVECEDKPSLVDFYSRNGFCEFDHRLLDADETDSMTGEYLVQMLKYIQKPDPPASLPAGQ